MRNFKFSLPLAALFVIGMVFTACQKDNVLTEASKQNRFMYSDSWFSIAEENCAGEPIEFCFTYTGNRTVQIQQYDAVLDDWFQIYAKSNSAEHCDDLVFNDAGTYLLRYFVSGQGGPSGQEFTITVENCGCEDEFSAVLECDEDGNKTLTVTFTAENAGDYVIQGGLTNGTTIVSRTADAGFTENTTHPGVVNSNANVTRWEGSLDACETVTIIIEYTGGAGVGSWSAKSVVDGVEVTNGESDDQDCP